jgi:large subunit ribosomal protein L14
MISQETKFPIVDNSGAKRVLCIKVLRQKIGYPGSICVVTVKKAKLRKTKRKKQIKKGDIVKALVLSTKHGLYRGRGYRIYGGANYGLILKRDNSSLPFGNRVKRPVFYEVRSTFSKILVMAPSVI